MKMTIKRAATTFAALSLLGGGALAVAPAASAAPAPGAFSTPTFSGLASSLTLPAKGYKDVKFSIAFTGTPSDKSYTDVNGDGAVVQYRDSSSTDFTWGKPKTLKTVAKKNTFTPSLYNPIGGDIVPGTNAGFYIRLYSSMAPGKYQFRVPITQSFTPAGSYTDVKTVRWAIKTVTVKANKKYSKQTTSANAPGWRAGGTTKITIRASEYKVGAKVKGFYRANGSKTTHSLGKVKLKRKKGSAQALLKTRQLTRSGKVWFKVGKNKFAGKYSTRKFTITVHRY